MLGWTGACGCFQGLLFQKKKSAETFIHIWPWLLQLVCGLTRYVYLDIDIYTHYIKLGGSSAEKFIQWTFADVSCSTMTQPNWVWRWSAKKGGLVLGGLNFGCLCSMADFTPAPSWALTAAESGSGGASSQTRENKTKTQTTREAFNGVFFWSVFWFLLFQK